VKYIHGLLAHEAAFVHSSCMNKHIHFSCSLHNPIHVGLIGTVSADPAASNLVSSRFERLNATSGEKYLVALRPQGYSTGAAYGSAPSSNDGRLGATFALSVIRVHQ